MTLGSARHLVEAAAQSGGAVPAFNVLSLDQAEAVVAGAEVAGRGILLQVSENAVRFHGRMEPLLAACHELALASTVPVGIHLDHFESPALIDEALRRANRFGVRSLMVDASKLEFSHNQAQTASVVERARELGWWIEAELGEVGGKDGAHAPGVRTDPAQAADFVQKTGVDALAVAVGSSHAMTERTAALDLDLIRALAARVPVPLVLHGSSGVPNDELAKAVAAGIRKVNIGTVLNVAGTAALRSELARLPDTVDPRRYGALGRTEVASLVAQLCEVVSGASSPSPSASGDNTGIPSTRRAFAE